MQNKSHTAEQTSYSFRWGITTLDEGERGGMYVYGWMYRNWKYTGITRNDFLCIQHLAAYHYETAKGQSRPGLAAIASQMGYKTVRAVQLLIAHMKEVGMVEVTEQPGFTNIYDFHAFALACLDSEAKTKRVQLNGEILRATGKLPPKKRRATGQKPRIGDR